MKVELQNSEIPGYKRVPAREFPKYTTQLMNLANQNSQGTRPKVVGQMSDLIQKFPGQTYEEWIAWYKKQKPDAIDNAIVKIILMRDKLIEALNEIDRDLVRLWVEDLVFLKTFNGFKIQEAILRKLAEMKGCDYRLANSDEESQNIDGFVGKEAYSIKPSTYRSKANLAESIDIKIIFYDKKKDGVVFEIPEDF